MNDERSTLPWLILMIKAPEPGRVKTRLGAEIGPERAAAFYRRFVEMLVDRFLAAGGLPWTPVIAFTPGGAEADIRAWLAGRAATDCLYLAQAEGDLGARLEGLFRQGFERGAPAVVALGSDCLTIARGEIEACFRALESAPLALGPTLDGGYWTIGMSGPHYDLLRAMPWSQPSLADATRERARALGLAIAEQGVKFDIDTREDLNRLPAELLAEIGLPPLA